MVQDEGADPAHEVLRGAQALEQRAGRLDSLFRVPGRADAPLRVGAGGERLAEIVAERAEHQGKIVVASIAKPGRFVDYQQRVHPDIAFGMPLGILGHAGQRFELGKEAQQSARLEEMQPGRGSAPLEEQLAKLLEDALARYLVERRPAAQVHEDRVGRHLEAGDELRHSQRPQGVFGEGARVGGAEHAALEVPSPSEGVDDLVGEGVAGHAVDGEVAPPRRALEVEVGIARHREAAMPRCDLAVAARQREVRIDVGEAQHPEALSHAQHATERPEKGFQRGQLEPEDLDIGVLGIEPEEAVAHMAADEQGPPACRLHRAGDVQDHRIQHARIIASAAPPRSPGSGAFPEYCVFRPPLRR